jgi:hypothetical protein
MLLINCNLHRRKRFYVSTRDSSVGIATVRAGGPRVRGSSPGRVKNFLHVVHTGSGVHPASFPMGTGGSFSGGRAAGA